MCFRLSIQQEKTFQTPSAKISHLAAAFSAALISELKRVEIQKLTFVFVLAYFLKSYDNKAICELKLNLKQSFKRWGKCLIFLFFSFFGYFKD